MRPSRSNTMLRELDVPWSSASRWLLPVMAGLALSRLDAAQAQVFDLDVVVDAVARALAAEPRLLHAAERDFRGRDQAGVDADHAVLERFADAEDAADVAAVEITREAELG